MTKLYEVQTRIGNDWENVWRNTNADGMEEMQVFLSFEEAQKELRDHIDAENMAIFKGDMLPSDDEFRIVEVQL